MEYIEIITFSLLAIFLGLTSIILTYLYINRFRFIQEIISYSLDFVANTEDNQKLLYQISGLIASGIKGGIGIDLSTVKRAGKLKWQDLVIELAAQYFKNSGVSPSPSPAPSPTPSSTDILAKKMSDKW